MEFGKMTKAELEEMLETASVAYYNTDEKVLSDTEFDELKDYYESKYGDFKVGAPAPEGKGTVNVEHAFGHLVGTLTKTNTIAQFKEWLEKTVENAGEDRNKVKFLMSLKYDGNSVVIEFKDGKCHQALTRGRDGRGLDLTHVFKNCEISDKRHVGVKFEVIMRYEEFDKLNEDLNETYKNPRSVTAGILGRDNAYEFFDYLTLVPLDYDVKGEQLSEAERLKLMKTQFEGKSWSKVPYSYNLFEGDLDAVVEKLEKMYKYISSKRDTFEFMIDGIVIEMIGKKYRNLGWVNSKPKWACALKFPYMEQRSVVTGFDFTLGTSGRITPRVWFQPVTFNGATQTKVSLANYDRYQELKLGIGSDILVQYRNDCLSYVEKLSTENNETVAPYPFTEKCPVCGGEVEISDTGAFAFCSNELCPNKVVGRVERYLTKLDVKGIKAATLEKLYENGLLKDIHSLYELDYKKVAAIDGLGKKSADIMKKAITGKVPFDYELLAGIGIEDLGNTMAKVLCKEYSLAELLEMSKTKTFLATITKIEGFSDISAGKLLEGLKLYEDELSKLITATNAKIYKDSIVKPSGVTYTFCVTGSINGWSNRDALKNYLESLGHKVSSGVSSKTNYLINNDVDSTSGKNKKAKELNVPIINEEQLKELLGL